MFEQWKVEFRDGTFTVIFLSEDDDLQDALAELLESGHDADPEALDGEMIVNVSFEGMVDEPAY